MAKWYVYADDEVQGPYQEEALEGKITEDIQVCRAGTEDWQKAGEVDQLKSLFEQKEPPAAPEPKKESKTSPTEPTPDRKENELDEPPEQPTLSDLHMLSKQAADEELTREYDKFWDEYDRAEKRVLRNEMMDRNIWPEDEPEEEKQGAL